MKIVVDPFALMDGDGLDGRDVLRQLLDLLLGGMGDLVYRLEVVVLDVNLVERKKGDDLDHFPIDRRHRKRPFKRGADAFLAQMFADVIARDRSRRTYGFVPDDEIAQLRVLPIRESLDLVAWSILGQLSLVARDYVLGAKAPQGIGANQEREVSEVEDELPVIPAAVDHQAGDP